MWNHCLEIQRKSDCPAFNGDTTESHGARAAGSTTVSAMFRSNLQRTGVYDAKGVKELRELKWKFKTDGWVSASPAIAGDGVLFGSLDGNLYSLDAGTGRERWRFDAKSPIYSSS